VTVFLLQKNGQITEHWVVNFKSFYVWHSTHVQIRIDITDADGVIIFKVV